VTILFATGAAEAFDELPDATKRRAAHCLDLLPRHPRMYPIRRRGLMRGYRYFVADRHLFYYSIAGDEIRLSAIIPAAMRRA
jgi:plasmid stabilization system protein ParE